MSKPLTNFLFKRTSVPEKSLTFTDWENTIHLSLLKAEGDCLEAIEMREERLKGLDTKI